MTTATEEQRKILEEQGARFDRAFGGPRVVPALVVPRSPGEPPWASPRPPIGMDGLVPLSRSLDILGRKAFDQRWPVAWFESGGAVRIQNVDPEDLPSVALGGLLHLLETGRLRSVAVAPFLAELPPEPPWPAGDPWGGPRVSVRARHVVELHQTQWFNWRYSLDYDDDALHRRGCSTLAIRSEMCIPRRAAKGDDAIDHPVPWADARLAVFVVEADLDELTPEQVSDALTPGRRPGRETLDKLISGYLTNAPGLTPATLRGKLVDGEHATRAGTGIMFGGELINYRELQGHLRRARSRPFDGAEPPTEFRSIKKTRG